MEENKYQIAYYDLKQSLKGEKYLGQEVKKLDLGDTLLVKSQTEDGKLCWIVENKKENISPDYIEAFENIIFQKRDNGYISDAYRNDISVVYEALDKLEKSKNKEAELINNNKNKEYIQNDIELTNKLVESFSETQKGEKNMKSLEALKDLFNEANRQKSAEYKFTTDELFTRYDVIKKDLKQFEVIQKKPTFFDEYMDAEITPLVIALSQLKGIKTYDSCCGHLKEPARIFFKCNDFDSLAIIGRAFDDRYSDGKWYVKIATQDEDEEGFPTLCIYIESKKPFDNWEEMFKSVNDCSYYINYWKENFGKENNIVLKDIEVEETTSD